MHKLMTTAGKHLSDKAWDVYPRPQLRRKNYVNLNGQWDFAVTQSDEIPSAFTGIINVPFPVESDLSGVAEHFSEGSRLWYGTSFAAPEGERVLLHIDGVDQKARVFLNGELIADDICTILHGSETVDITTCIRAENQLVICVTDDLNDKSFPYGKQTLKRGGMWYTPVSGIWQTVWLEGVPNEYISGIKITPFTDRAEIEIFGMDSGVAICEGREYEIANGRVTIKPENPKLWSPESPDLYELTLRAGEDEVQSYFALRTIGVKDVNGIKRLCLNGRPYFFHGLLDQGYWPDGIYTPASPECYADDILGMKALGFNTLRKHIKIEPQTFYYDCDRLGMIVFQDMVNNGSYSFMRDTALPTAGMQKLGDKHLNRDEKCRRAFVEAMENTVKRLYNHPCICYWTVFNEGWGQFESSVMYHKMKAFDTTRIVDSTSGWFRCGKTDVDSRHVYFKPFKMPKSDMPVVLSEFGGYVYKDAEHSFNPDKTYGYRYFKKCEDFESALVKLYSEEIIPAVKEGLCAAIYTQVSDVEDETNGLVTYDRKVCKLSSEKMQDISKKLQEKI